MAAPSCLGQNLLNFFVIPCLKVAGAPLELMEFLCHPEVVKGRDARQVNQYFFVKILCKGFPGVDTGC